MADESRSEIIVPVDTFEVVQQDVVLVANIRSTFALCFYDAVHESGALLHMQMDRPGKVDDPELTDNTLSTNLLLMDQCVDELRRADPRARYWQARFLAHAGGSKASQFKVDAIQGFVAAYLQDCKITLVSSAVHIDAPQRLRFRPAMGSIRSAGLPDKIG